MTHVGKGGMFGSNPDNGGGKGKMGHPNPAGHFGPPGGLDTSLGGAVKELNEQHPEKYDDLGPHNDCSHRLKNY